MHAALFNYRICGDYGSDSIQKNVFAKKLLIMFWFGGLTNPCVTIMGSYTAL